jgi:hypothetical protein
MIYRRETRWRDAPFWQSRRRGPATPIRLDPETVLQRVARDPRDLMALAGAGHLAAADLERLYGLCAPPIAAHRAVRAFQQSASRPVADEQVIRALQALHAQDFLAAVRQ